MTLCFQFDQSYSRLWRILPSTRDYYSSGDTLSLINQQDPVREQAATLGQYFSLRLSCDCSNKAAFKAHLIYVTRK